ncbi:RiPP maturation radical SAM C-methyltransferase [Sorangium sp. So ce131]|uniref:RiPP maturation radical SAM C-methyltransferase n=1 Tax=Sorangium sp. So ce131 TaxID=3133282 RepID=UPI003F61D6C2
MSTFQRTTPSVGCAPLSLHPGAQGARALLLVPPFARFDLPHLGVHLLQACARRAGSEVAVLYPGMHLAREIGEQLYHAIAESTSPHMYGERIFARAAYGVPLLGRRAEEALAGLRQELVCHEIGRGATRCIIDYDLLRRLATHAEGWVDRMAEAITSLGCPVVGCTAMFEQTAASIALLRRVKRRAPSTVTVFGGANSFGDMAEGIASLSPAVDYVFSGESERAFPAFLAGVLAGERPAERVVQGEPCADLEGLPTPDYTDYYAQRRTYLGEDPAALGQILLPYESSRGCWWGQKHHCTFCGEAVMRYREKSAERVIEELGRLLERHPSRRVCNADDIMPHSYFKTLLPRLGLELPGLEVFYAQKANLTLKKVQALHRAGVTGIQPGIEALSSPLLRRIDKGILARQNIALLRYARSTYLSLVWSLIHGFPGDEPEDYAHYVTLLPLLRHLEPPRSFAPLLIFRFSPYWKWPERYGIKDLRPASACADILPEGVDASRIAYSFEGRFDSVITRAPTLVKAIQREVEAWESAWCAGDGVLPELSICRMAPDVYLMRDTRGLAGTLPLQLLPRTRAAAALVGRPLSSPGKLAPEIAWAASARCAVQLDAWHVPLATAQPELLEELEAEYGHEADHSSDDHAFIAPRALVRRVRSVRSG